MATTRKATFAVVGTGAIGPRHVSAIAACSEAQIVCLVDPDPKAQTLSEEQGVPLFQTVSKMLQAGYVPDAAVVCTPNSTHVRIGIELLDAGIHVLIEKPISNDIQSGQELIDTARRKDRRILVGHHRRFNPYINATKRALDEGMIGRPVAISGLWAAYKPASYFEEPSEWHAKAGEGGVVLINMIHEIDCLHYLFGSITRVYAEQITSHRGHEAEEGAAITLRFASGVVGTFVLSDATPSDHNWESATGENPMVMQTSRDCYRIFGLEGTLSVGDMVVVKYGENVQKSWTSTLEYCQLEVGNEVPFSEQIQHFVRVVRGEEHPRCSGEDGLRTLIVCDAIRRSMKEGMPVNVESSIVA